MERRTGKLWAELHWTAWNCVELCGTFVELGLRGNLLSLQLCHFDSLPVLTNKSSSVGILGCASYFEELSAFGKTSIIPRIAVI